MTNYYTPEATIFRSNHLQVGDRKSDCVGLTGTGVRGQRTRSPRNLTFVDRWDVFRNVSRYRNALSESLDIADRCSAGDTSMSVGEEVEIATGDRRARESNLFSEPWEYPPSPAFRRSSSSPFSANHIRTYTYSRSEFWIAVQRSRMHPVTSVRFRMSPLLYEISTCEVRVGWIGRLKLRSRKDEQIEIQHGCEKQYWRILLSSNEVAFFATGFAFPFHDIHFFQSDATKRWETYHARA